jgi:probable HAF family extracellular repeat protein
MKSRIVTSMIAIALLVVLAAAVRLAAHGQPDPGPQVHYNVSDLGTLGGSSAVANSINDLGLVTGVSNLAGNTIARATLWFGGLKIDLGTLGGPNSNSAVPWPVKDVRGIIVGISETSTPDPLGETFSCGAFIPRTGVTCQGFMWKDRMMTALPTLGGNNSFATAANNAGQVVGWAENTVHDTTCTGGQILQFRAVIWGPNPGQIQELPPLPGDLDSAATAINDQGQVVGISGACGVAVGGVSAAHAVLWENGKVIKLADLGGTTFNTPMAINNRGEIAGFALPASQNGTLNFHAVIWPKEGGIQDLNTLPGDSISEVTGLNDEGQIVGTSYTAGFASSRAFIYENGRLTDLNKLTPPGSPLYLIVTGDINDRGEIAGGACYPVSGVCDTTQEEPTFLATPRQDGFDVDNDPPYVALPESIRELIRRRHGLDH